MDFIFLIVFMYTIFNSVKNQNETSIRLITKKAMKQTNNISLNKYMTNLFEY